MTLEDLKNILAATGYPVTYREWPENKVPPMPYICYLSLNSNNFSADAGVYITIKQVQVELYTKEKNIEAEDKVEKALSSFHWEKTENYIDSEKCYQIAYEIEV